MTEGDGLSGSCKRGGDELIKMIMTHEKKKKEKVESRKGTIYRGGGKVIKTGVVEKHCKPHMCIKVLDGPFRDFSL